MRAARVLGSFLRAPARRKGLAVEAIAELGRARLLTLLPARVYTAGLGRLAAGEGDAATAPDGAATERAAEIGHMVEVVARRMPFRAACLQQAIAVKRMLSRRGLEATVLFGVSREAADRATPAAGAAAHAWVKVGATVVNGDANLAKFTVVARFG